MTEIQQASILNIEAKKIQDAFGNNLHLGDTIVTFSDLGKKVVKGKIISLGKRRATVEILEVVCNGHKTDYRQSYMRYKQYIDYVRAIKIETN